MKGGELKPKSKVTPKETAFLIKNLRGAKTLASISILGRNKKKFSHHSFKGFIKQINPRALNTNQSQTFHKESFSHRQ